MIFWIYMRKINIKKMKKKLKNPQPFLNENVQ